MPITSKSFAKSASSRHVKVSVKRVRKEQSEAARIEAYLRKEGFKPMTASEKARLKRRGMLGMPEE